MPNQNATKFKGGDPDPTDFLWPTMDMKKQNLQKPYDPKKSCWVPNKGTGGYDEGLIESADGDKISVKLLEGGDVSNTFLYIFVMWNSQISFNTKFGFSL